MVNEISGRSLEPDDFVLLFRFYWHKPFHKTMQKSGKILKCFISTQICQFKIPLKTSALVPGLMRRSMGWVRLLGMISKKGIFEHGR